MKEETERASIPQNDPRIADWIGRPLTDEMAAAIVAPWALGFVEQSLNVERADNKTATTIYIFERCEANANAARPENRD